MKNTHPINFIESLLAENGRICEVHLSRYRYHPQSLVEESTSYAIPVARLRDKYEHLEKILSDDEDIAFDSVVRLRGKGSAKCHLALLDFQTSDLLRITRASELLVREYCAPRAALVNSGRSYHLYMGIVLAHAAWVKFMGRALLLNTRGEPPTVDDRWIGHRLIGGHSGLRWSAKGKPFVPEIIQQLSCKPTPPARSAVTGEEPHPRGLHT
jgi:hypothetical protein